MGIDTTKYKVMAFTLGAAFAGTAGVLFAHYFYIAHPASFTFMRSFDILTMVVLGGLGSMTGSITGARRNSADFYFRLSGRISGMAHDYLLRNYDCPDAAPSAGIVRQ